MRDLGLSLGDRACLALAVELAGEVLTTDADLARFDVGVTATHLRS